MRHAILTLLLAPWLATGLGCNRNQSLEVYVPTDVKIGRLVSDMDDFCQDPRELTAVVPRLFAPDCKPSLKVLPRYADYHYEGNAPVQKGDTATIVVTVTDLNTKAMVGEVTWSMKKVPNEKGTEVWRLTDAPLPAK